MSNKNFFDEKIKEIAVQKNVIDLGGGGGFNKQLTKYQSLFKNNYRTVDIDPKTKPDIVGNIQNLPFLDGTVGGVICISVLEHVEDPAKAINEIYRILENGGKALVYVPFLFPYHAKAGFYKDFFRFSRDGIEYLFKRFKDVEIVPTRQFFEMWLLMLPKIGSKLALLGRLFDRVVPSKGNQVSGFMIYAVK
jgi:ubiquinone/menaquinone biosynthesis C-methylase UbiE